MCETVKTRGYAKINLFLRILEKKNDYHEIETLLQSIDLFDEITLSKSDSDDIVSDFEGDNSLVVLQKLKGTFHLGGMRLSIKKNIPLGGGLGGSTADAAAAALACASLWKLNLPLVKQTVAPLFGDLAFQMIGGTAIVRGFGEKVDLLPSLPLFHVLLAFPQKGVLTKEAYELSDSLKKGTGSGFELYCALTRQEKADRYYLNDLLPAAVKLNDEIAPLLEKMRDEKAFLTGMTGSGSTLFSLYRNFEDAKKAAATLPVRTLVTHTTDSFIAK